MCQEVVMTTRPCDMTLPQLEAALTRLATEHVKATPGRKQIIGRIVDSVLDEVLSRRGAGVVVGERGPEIATLPSSSATQTG